MTSELQIYRGYSDDDLQLFDLFASDVPPAPGFVTSFVGSRVRTKFLPESLAALDGQKLGPPVPADYLSEAVEWIGVLRSVQEASGRYAMMELGAGLGPWCTAAVAAARVRNIRDIKIAAVEADPERFRALEETVRDNNFTATLHNAAAGAACGVGSWPISSDGIYDAGLRLLGGRCDYRGHVVQETREVEIVALADLLSEQTRWDLVHVDVQGHEMDICSAAIDDLTKRVRRIVIGTHSRKLDGDIFDLFWRAGWLLENEKPSRVDFRPELPTLEVMTTHDGTQVWANPRLIYGSGR